MIPYDRRMLSRRTDLETTRPTRRLFLRGMAGAWAGAVVAPARLLAGPRQERLLSFVHTHTHERLSVPYFADGRAIGVRLGDVRTSTLRDAARELQRGGVGYYRGPDFVHVDTGRIRRW